MKNNENDFIMESIKDENNLMHAKGKYYISGATLVFSLHQQTRGNYLFRGSIRAISNETGHVLQMKGEPHQKKKKARQKKGKDTTGETYPIKCEFYIYPVKEETGEKKASELLNDTKTVKEIIKKKAIDLISQYANAIHADNQNISVDSEKFSVVVSRYSNHFFKSEKGRNLTEDTLKRKKHALCKLAALLDNYTMSTISQKALKQIFASFGKKAGTTFRLAQQFWEYCIEKGIYHGDNPFTTYLLHNSTKTRALPEELRRKALTPRSLSEETEKEVNQRIREANPEDSFTTGMLLIKEAGFTPKEACSLKWDDCYFNDLEKDFPTIRIRFEKEFIAGATHNFTRPSTFLCAHELLRRKKHLIEKYGSLKGHYILEDKKGKPINPKSLTDFCYQTMARCHAEKDNSQNFANPIGGGVRLLLAHYQHRISHICGAPESSGIKKFLTGQSLAGNVTADHYCSFTSPEGQLFLYNLLARDKRFFSPIPDKATLKEEHQNENTVFTVCSKDPRRFTKTTMTVELQPGEHLTITGDCMLHGNVRIKEIK